MYMDDLATEIRERQARQHLEDDLQATVVQFLRWALPVDALHWHVPNGGKRHRKEAARMVKLGVRAGIPDIHVAYQGRLYCVEMKPPGKAPQLNDAQKQVIPRLRGCGVPVAVCQSLHEVTLALLDWGIPLQAKPA